MIRYLSQKISTLPAKNDEPLDIAICIVRGMSLGYTEKEVYRMTLRKLDLLYIAYLKINGLYKEEKVKKNDGVLTEVLYW